MPDELNKEVEIEEGKEPVEAATFTQEDVDRMLAEERAKVTATATVVEKQPYVEPYEQAVAEAKEQGVDWDDAWVNRRASRIVEERADRRIEQLEREFNKRGAVDVARGLVGENPHAIEYARKFLERAPGPVTDPEVLDLLKRGAREYAREKAPKSTSMRVEPGYSEPLEMGSRTKDDMREVNEIIGRVNSGAALTEDDLRGVA